MAKPATGSMTTYSVSLSNRELSLSPGCGAGFLFQRRKTVRWADYTPRALSATSSRGAWRKEYGGMQVNQARRLKELERENTRLKKLLAEAMLDHSILKEASSGNY